MGREWVQAARDVVRFWIWQFLACFFGIPILVAFLVSYSESAVGIVPVFLIAYFALVVVYAIKIANFFKCVNSAGGAIPRAIN